MQHANKIRLQLFYVPSFRILSGLRAVVSQTTGTILVKDLLTARSLAEELSDLKHNEDDHYQITSLKHMAQEMIVADKSLTH